MSSSDELKSKIENFLQMFTQQISDAGLVETIQSEYNQLMDFYSKLTVMSNEDLEGIENEITNLNTEVNKLNNQNLAIQKEKEELIKYIKNYETKSKVEAEKTEGLMEKIKILQNTVESFSSKTNESETITIKLNQTIAELKNDNSNLMNKYHTLIDEMEINNKNVKKNFTLELTIKQLTEENEKLSSTIKNLQNIEDYKVKFLQVQSELKEMNEKYSLLNNSYRQFKAENDKLSNENFDKFNLINNLEKDIKIKNHKIEEYEKENKNLSKQIREIDSKLKEAEYCVKTKKTVFDNQMKELKREIDKLVKNNEIIKKELNDATEQLKKYQHYTNFAKASKEILSKRDFSILETMSRRVEELTNLNDSLRLHVQALGTENEILREKVNSSENLIFYYMKDDVEIMKKRNENTTLPEDEYIQIKEMISNPSNLIDIVYLLKKENFNLQREIAEITIECNKLLRSSNVNMTMNANEGNKDK